MFYTPEYSIDDKEKELAGNLVENPNSPYTGAITRGRVAPTEEGSYFRGKAEDALKRGRISIDTTQSDKLFDQSLGADRGRQNAALGMYDTAARGGGPNVAQARFSADLDSLMSQQAGQSPGLASLAAARAAAASGYSANAAAAGTRFGEQMAANQGGLALRATKLQDDLNAAALGVKKADAKAAIDAASAEQNLKAAMGLDQLGLAYDTLLTNNRTNSTIQDYQNALGLYGLQSDMNNFGPSMLNNMYGAMGSQFIGMAPMIGTAIDQYRAGDPEPPKPTPNQLYPGYNPEFGF